jgi:DNA-binding LacI/PurR family transcriptional regulator
MLLSRIDAERLDLAGELTASGRAIGVILIGQWHHHDQINELAARQFPIVVWGAQLPQQLYCTIGCDNIAGGMRATEHLLANGCRRIAFFGDIALPEVGHRFAGYQRALASHGIAPAADLVHHAPFAPGSAHHAIAKLLDLNTAFDAIFASSDMLAMEAISALRDRGLVVPDDVAVAGYCHPSLTTIRQPVASGAEAMVDALLGFVDGSRPLPKILATELIVRESTVKSVR